jgi:hypothetical protein
MHPMSTRKQKGAACPTRRGFKLAIVHSPTSIYFTLMDFLHFLVVGWFGFFLVKLLDLELLGCLRIPLEGKLH